MYVLVKETKILVPQMTDDPHFFNLYIDQNGMEMQDIYDLFKKADLSEISVYNDDDTLYGVYKDYKTITGFSLDIGSGWVCLSLSKVLVEDIETKVNGISDSLDEFKHEVSTFKTSVEETTNGLSDSLAQVKSDAEESISQVKANMEETASGLSASIDQVKNDMETSVNGDLARQSNYALQVFAMSLTDEQALNCVLLFDEWDPNGKQYKKDDRFRYNEKFWKVLQDHTSQENWIPGEASSLYVEISDPAIEWPEWKQPTGSHDAYNTGDKVTYEGEHYISKIDANTTVPGSDERWWEKQQKEDQE